MMESFWSTMQIELLNRKKWKTRIELANAIFEYIEVFYNRRRNDQNLWMALGEVACKGRTFPRMICKERRL